MSDHEMFDRNSEAKLKVERKKLTQEDKVNWAKQKRSEMEGDLKKFLQEALETKDGMDKLTAHYRISGTYAYSFYNNMMIMLQGGSICGSKSNWAKFKRKVTDFKAKSIYVLRPIMVKDRESTDPKKLKCIGFTPSRTWDVSQTSGEPLEFDHNSSEVMDVPFSKVKEALETITGVKLIETNTGTSRGSTSGSDLKVSEFSNDTDKTKSGIHEAAHKLIHTSKAKVKHEVSRPTMEVEAESVAYLAMSYLGLDFELSKAYVKAWESGVADCRHSLIIKTADKIINALKDVMTDTEKFSVAI